MSDFNHNVRWQISLSNGETFFEGKGKFKVIKGELSPWKRLLSYIEEKDLEIRSISLINGFGQTFNLPSVGSNPKFKQFDELEKPTSYNFFRVIGTDIKFKNMKETSREIAGWFTVISAEYPKYSLQIWVDEQNSNRSWTMVKEINEK
jgi:hypothetical protein